MSERIDRYLIEYIPQLPESRVGLLEDCSLADTIEHYCIEVVDRCRSFDSGPRQVEAERADTLARSIFRVLISRKVANCSKTQSRRFEPSALRSIEANIRRDEPIRFFLDIGGGYHAGLTLPEAGRDGEHLCFEPNGLHVLCLSQVGRLHRLVSSLYPPGIRMTLVIDNLVAHIVNDIPLSSTLEFARKLRLLIARLGMDSLVDVLVESEVCSLVRDDAEPFDCESTEPLSGWEYENVLRFSYRRHDRREAGRRQCLYARVCRLSEQRLEPHLDGMHLTQRLSESCLSFRSFPGGSARMQTGRLCFVETSRGEVVPKLLTTSNLERSRLLFVPAAHEVLAQFLPEPIPEGHPVTQVSVVGD